MKILFLDIDGVLNSMNYSKQVVRRSLIADETSIDPQTVKILQSLLDEMSDLRIIISSTWRRFHSLDELKTILASYGLDSSKILGVTPKLDTIRGEEIKSWLNTQSLKSDYPVHQFVILDDDADMGSLISHLIQTSHQIGLTTENITQIKDFFSKNPVSSPFY